MNIETADNLAKTFSKRLRGYVCIVKTADGYDVIVNNPITAKTMGYTVVKSYYNGKEEK